jgi:hypothetical protein
MTRTLTIALLFAAGIATVDTAHADCAGPTLADVRQSYLRAQTAERNNDAAAALHAYAAATSDTCENSNPYQADAAVRAARLGRALGEQAERRKDLQSAFDDYETGGHYAAADRVFMAIARGQAEDPQTFQNAREHFANRALPAFRSNHAAALRAAGAYAPDARLVAEVAAMPARAVETLQRQEAAAFDERYLRERVQLVGSRPEDPADVAALQRYAAANEAFSRKWSPDDPLKRSLRKLERLRQWAANTVDEAQRAKLAARVAQIAGQRATVLTQNYSGAPELLNAAMDYERLAEDDAGRLEARLAQVRARAQSLGDAAGARRHFALAADYYDAAGLADKAAAAREQRNQLAMARMQPDIGAAQQQAAELQKAFGDPAAVAAMRAQAEAMRRSLQQGGGAAAQ